MCDKCGNITGPAHTDERCAHDCILKWCRSNPRGEGIPVMRNLHKGDVGIVNLSAAAVSSVVARASTWGGVLAALRASGRAL